MSVPETAVNEDAGAVFPQHDVRTPRQMRMVQTVPESVGEQVLSDYHFRLDVGRVNGSHVFVPQVLREGVHNFVLLCVVKVVIISLTWYAVECKNESSCITFRY